jgi:hypothetical protein
MFGTVQIPKAAALPLLFRFDKLKKIKVFHPQF